LSGSRSPIAAGLGCRSYILLTGMRKAVAGFNSLRASRRGGGGGSVARLGYLNPLFAGIAMSASPLIVVANLDRMACMAGPVQGDGLEVRELICLIRTGEL